LCAPYILSKSQEVAILIVIQGREILMSEVMGAERNLGPYLGLLQTLTSSASPAATSTSD